jgi:hypothetical protein
MGNIDDDTRSGILALDRLPEEPKAVLARAARSTSATNRIAGMTSATVRRYVDYVVAEIERLTDEPDKVERQRGPLDGSSP